MTQIAVTQLGHFLFLSFHLAMISYNVVVGDTLSKVLVQFVPSLGASMGSVRFFIVFLVTLVGRTFL